VERGAARWKKEGKEKNGFQALYIFPVETPSRCRRFHHSPSVGVLQTDGFCSLVPGAPQFPRTDLNRMKSADFGTIWSPFSYQKFSPPL